MMDPSQTWLLATAGLVVFGALLIAAIYYRRQSAKMAIELARAHAQANRTEALLSTTPFIGLLPLPDSGAPGDPAAETGARSLGHALGLDKDEHCDEAIVLGALEADSAKHLSEAIERFKATGTAFSTRVAVRDSEKTLEACSLQLPCGTIRDQRLHSHAVVFTDVTETAKAEAESLSRERRIRDLLQVLPIPIWCRTEDLKVADCNQAYALAVDASRDDVIRDGLELLGRNKMHEGREIARLALTSGVPQSALHHVVIDGARRLLEIREQQLPDGGLLGLAIDRTAVEDLESELKRHTEAHAAVLENLGTAMAIYGSDLRLAFYNSAYAHLWQLDEAFCDSEPHFGDVLEALREGRRLPEHPDFPVFKRDAIKTYGTLIEPMEQLDHLPDGTTLRMLAIPHPFGGVLFSYEDVTDRLALERSYNTLIEVQRETLNKLYEGVAVYGADGRLKLFNPAFAQIWGLGEDFLNGEPHVREVLERSRDFFGIRDEAWNDYVESAVGLSTEPEARSGRRERPDDSVIDWTQVPLPDGAVLFTFVDVTDSIRVERALLERNEALEMTDRLKTEFIANISYELRTPLNAIIGFAEILENQFFGELNERQLEYSHAIVESSQRLIALINDILDLASIEAGYLRLERESTDIRALLEAIHTLGRERAHNQNIELKLECADDAGTLFADTRRLKQAVFNLLSNALKFSKAEGTITLAAARSDHEILLSVADTGVGIALEDQERIFGKFERGTGQARQSGAGLGLSLVKSLIELHNGWVEIESAPGEGTKVTCHIPEERNAIPRARSGQVEST